MDIDFKRMRESDRFIEVITQTTNQKVLMEFIKEATFAECAIVLKFNSTKPSYTLALNKIVKISLLESNNSQECILIILNSRHRLIRIKAAKSFLHRMDSVDIITVLTESVDKKVCEICLDLIIHKIDKEEALRICKVVKNSASAVRLIKKNLPTLSKRKAVEIIQNNIHPAVVLLLTKRIIEKASHNLCLTLALRANSIGCCVLFAKKVLKKASINNCKKMVSQTGFIEVMDVFIPMVRKHVRDNGIKIVFDILDNFSDEEMSEEFLIRIKDKLSFQTKLKIILGETIKKGPAVILRDDLIKENKDKNFWKKTLEDLKYKDNYQFLKVLFYDCLDYKKNR